MGLQPEGLVADRLLVVLAADTQMKDKVLDNPLACML
jgi:hypothetical protein